MFLKFDTRKVIESLPTIPFRNIYLYEAATGQILENIENG
jgi:hypothetical protein